MSTTPVPATPADVSRARRDVSGGPSAIDLAFRGDAMSAVGGCAAKLGGAHGSTCQRICQNLSDPPRGPEPTSGAVSTAAVTLHGLLERARRTSPCRAPGRRCARRAAEERCGEEPGQQRQPPRHRTAMHDEGGAAVGRQLPDPARAAGGRVPGQQPLGSTSVTVLRVGQTTRPRRLMPRYHCPRRRPPGLRAIIRTSSGDRAGIRRTSRRTAQTSTRVWPPRGAPTRSSRSAGRLAPWAVKLHPGPSYD